MDRRSFLKGAAALFAAPAIVKAEILMPVKQPIWQPHSVMGVISGVGTVDQDIYYDQYGERFYLYDNQIIIDPNHPANEKEVEVGDLYGWLKHECGKDIKDNTLDNVIIHANKRKLVINKDEQYSMSHVTMFSGDLVVKDGGSLAVNVEPLHEHFDWDTVYFPDTGIGKFR